MPPATVCGPEAGSSAFGCAPARSRRGSHAQRSTSSRFGLERRSDAALVALAQSGAESAYEEILRRYRRQLHAYCSQMLGPSRAEDAVQQTFLQAFVALRRGSDREINLRPWLYRISHNCSIDMLRKNGWDYDELDPEYDGVAQPPQLLEQKQDLEKVVGAMRALPERQRRALALRELEGRSYSEIGAELGHSDAGVRQLIFRARSTLRAGAAAIALPFALLRSRFATQLAPVSDVQQAAVAASLGGDSAGVGLAKASAVLVAGLSLLTAGPADRKAGDSRASHHSAAAIAGAPGEAGNQQGPFGARHGGVSVAGGSLSNSKTVSLPGTKGLALTPAAGAPATTVGGPQAAAPAPVTQDQPSTDGTSGPGTGPAGGDNDKGGAGEQPGAGGGKSKGGGSQRGTPRGKKPTDKVGGDAPTQPVNGVPGSKRTIKKDSPGTTTPRQPATKREKAEPKTNNNNKTSVPKQSAPRQSVPKTVPKSQPKSQPKATPKSIVAPKSPSSDGSAKPSGQGQSRGSKPASAKGSPASGR